MQGITGTHGRVGCPMGLEHLDGTPGVVNGYCTSKEESDEGKNAFGVVRGLCGAHRGVGTRSGRRPQSGRGEWATLVLQYGQYRHSGVGTGGPSGVANPYPSNITVSGLSDLVDTVTVTLNNLSHTFPADIDILLVGPEGQTLILMSDRGGGFDISNATLTFDDAAAASLPGNVPIVTGTFKPTDFFDFGEVGGDIFPAPAPAPSGATTLATFNGTDPNGTWSLYVVDDREFDVGSIAGGWCVTITTAPVLVFTFAGFFPPVDNLPTFNTVKAGRAIPVKFSLEGDQGLAIFASGSPASQQIACDSSASLAPIEETVPAGGSQLTYDAATDTYTYVWKTAEAWAGTCRLLILRLTDGSEHLAQFAFR